MKRVVMLLVVMGVAAVSQGALLNLSQQYPDVTSGLIETDYTASSGSLTFTGVSLSLDVDGVSPLLNIIGGTFAIDMTVDSLGSATGGTLVIGGTIPDAGAMSGTLLTANLSDFGFMDGPGEIFEFIFTATGGDLAVMTSGVGSPVGVILDAFDSGFSGSFTQDFGSQFNVGVADAFYVPEPISMVLLTLGGLVSLRRR